MNPQEIHNESRCRKKKKTGASNFWQVSCSVLNVTQQYHLKLQKQTPDAVAATSGVCNKTRSRRAT
jgi:hypothetical protein